MPTAALIFQKEKTVPIATPVSEGLTTLMAPMAVVVLMKAQAIPTTKKLAIAIPMCGVMLKIKCRITDNTATNGVP